MNGAKGETSTVALVADDPLQPPVCTGCGYELIGLAPDCVCPECGVQRDPQAIVLCGYATDRRQSTLTTRAGNNFKWWNWVSTGSAVFLLICFARHPLDLSSLLMVGVSVQILVVFLLGLYAYHRQKNEGHLPVHAIIHPQGACQRSAFGKHFKLTRLSGDHVVEFGATREGLRTLTITRPRRISFFESLASYQPVAIEFRAGGETVARTRAILNDEKS